MLRDMKVHCSRAVTCPNQTPTMRWLILFWQAFFLNWLRIHTTAHWNWFILFTPEIRVGELLNKWAEESLPRSSWRNNSLKKFWTWPKNIAFTGKTHKLRSSRFFTQIEPSLPGCAHSPTSIAITPVLPMPGVSTPGVTNEPTSAILDNRKCHNLGSTHGASSVVSERKPWWHQCGCHLSYRSRNV